MGSSVGWWLASFHSQPLSGVFMSPQGPNSASYPCIPLVRFFSPEAAQERDENHLRAFRELLEGAGGGEVTKNSVCVTIEPN